MSKGQCEGYCDEEAEPVELYHDHSSPPISYDPCLCYDCSKQGAEEEIARIEADAQADGIDVEVTIHDH